MADITEKGPRASGYPDSGDVSGKGRERRHDGDVFPQKRDLDEMGTHGGSKRSASQDAGEQEGYKAPENLEKDAPYNKT